MHKLIIFLIILSSFLYAQETLHIKNANIYTMNGAALQNGEMIVRDGKIIQIGLSGEITPPANATTIDLNGKIVMPGLVDTHSHLGGGDGGDRSSSTHPDVRILDAIDPQSDSFMKALAGGITTINVMPGSGHLMSGQTLYLKLRKSPTISGLLFCEDELNEICGGLKMANGTNSIRTEAPFPGTRAKSAAIIRQLFIKAQDYKNKITQANGNKDKMPPRDIEMETLVQVLNQERIVHHHTHKANDILTVLRLAKEFNFKVVLHHVTEAWMVADEIAKAAVPCSIILLDSPGGKLETVNLSFNTGAVLEKAGVNFAYHTDDGITDSRFFLRSAALGVRGGLSKTKALESLTIEGAKMLGLENRIGSLEIGKDADFIVLSGDPFSIYTRVEQTWVEGKKLFDLSDPKDKAYSTGGYDVYRGNFEFQDHCGGEH
jgi:imidazolonepropionase-like amidohydrolase